MVSTINIPGWLPVPGGMGALCELSGVGPDWTPISPSDGFFFRFMRTFGADGFRIRV